MNRTDRLYALVEQLRAVSPRPLSARRLAEHFEVSTRTVERDVAALQGAGVPIWAEPGRTGGYVLDRRTSLPPVNFTPAEATALAVTLARAPDDVFGAAARAALRKVLEAMPERDAAVTRALVERMRVAGGPRDAVPGPPRLPAALGAGLAGGRCVRLGYVDGTGTRTDRVVEPVVLLGGAGGWYLAAWCRLRDAIRVFRLDRVVDAELLAEPTTARDVESVLPPVEKLQVRAVTV